MEQKENGNDIILRVMVPEDYDRMLRSIAQAEARGLSREQAELEAFYQSAR